VIVWPLAATVPTEAVVQPGAFVVTGGVQPVGIRIVTEPPAIPPVAAVNVNTSVFPFEPAETAVVGVESVPEPSGAYVLPPGAGTGAGAGRGTTTVNFFALVAVPSFVVTLTFPDFAFRGTVAVILVAELTLNFALTPANLTVLTAAKRFPVIVTLAPTLPLAGLKPVIEGLAVTASAEPASAKTTAVIAERPSART
jgi:hypothetical protein